MLRVMSSPRKLCTGLTRRDLLRVGGLGLAGLSLADLLRFQSATADDVVARPTSFGRAKNVIVLHLYGSPSQLETFDCKPEAPVEIRGELGVIPSSLPGLQVGELLPHTSKVMDRVTVLRSMTHPYPLHGVAFALTGVPVIDVAMELSPHDPRHWPFFGSVVDYVDTQRTVGQSRPCEIPQNIALPWAFSSRRVGEVPRAGPYAAFLGNEFNPVWTDFLGTATKSLPKTLQDKTYTDNDPYIGCTAESYFTVPSVTSLLDDITIDRLDSRRSLLDQLDDQRRALAEAPASRQHDRFQRMSYDLINSEKLRTALDVRREDAGVRDLYGDTLFGQACLAARRLLEGGGRVVTVFWDEFGLAGSGWDTHWNHYPRMKVELCPGFDRAWYGLISDLEQRGLLDETLVVCTSEHGRTPQINGSNGAGRDHWSRAYSTLMAGAGVKRGFVYGRTDKIAGDVEEQPVSPKDQLATMYHLLGIDHHTEVRDAQGRPFPLVDGRVIHEILA